MTSDLTVAGRTFRPVSPLSAWQIGYFGAHLRAAKADSLVLASQAGHEASFDALVERLLVSYHLYHLLAAGLVEVRDGMALPWGDGFANQLAALLAGLTDVADITALRPKIQELLAAFFPSAPASPPISPNSLVPTTASSTSSEAFSTSQAGTSLRAESVAGSGTGRKRSSGGRRAKSASPQ